MIDGPPPNVEERRLGGRGGRRRKRQLERTRRDRRRTRWALAVLITLGAILASVVVALTAASAFIDSLPKLENQKPIAIGENSSVYSADGTRLGLIPSAQNRIPVKWKQISPWLKNATIAIEDRRYWQHGALDYEGIFRAAWHDVVAGRVVEGGSTIAQQVVRNLYIRNANLNRTFRRKVDEAWLAIQLERKWTKAKILTTYLNIVFYGNNAYGAEAGAQTYFSRHADELNLAQAALLAGLPQAPSDDDPLVHPKAARRRRNEVLRAMLSQHVISFARYLRAKNAPLDTQPGDSIFVQPYRQPYWVNFVRDQMIKKFGKKRVAGGGLRVVTTLDRKLEAVAKSSISGILKTPGDPQAALVAIDPRTGDIKAMATSSNYQSTPVNYATSRRQPGSTMKTFALTYAVSQGVDPSTTYYHSGPIDITDPRCLGANNAPWHVERAEPGSGGTISLYSATLASDNTVFAQLAVEIGPDNIVREARRMGVEHAPLKPVCSIVLGSQDISPLEMASSYATLAAMGVYHRPRAIKAVYDTFGQVAKQRTGVQKRRVMTDGTAYVVTKILEENTIAGTGSPRGRLPDGRPEAGKTGTAENYDNAWYCGYTPDLATCVWIGYADAETHAMGSVEGFYPVFGGTLPAEIWTSFMSQALSNTPPTPWPLPKHPAVFSNSSLFGSGSIGSVASSSSSSSTTTTGATTTGATTTTVTVHTAPVHSQPVTTSAPPPTTVFTPPTTTQTAPPPVTTVVTPPTTTDTPPPPPSTTAPPPTETGGF